MRLIDANALKEDFKKRLRDAKNWKENALNIGDNEIAIRAEATIDFICEVIMTIDNAPTVETERPKGKWICEDILHCLYYCSECRNNGEHIQPFCAWCGADMRGDK